MLQFKQMKDACPKYVLTPGSNTSDIIYRRAALLINVLSRESGDPSIDSKIHRTAFLPCPKDVFRSLQGC